jgi:hypothetical protein
MAPWQVARAGSGHDVRCGSQIGVALPQRLILIVHYPVRWRAYRRLRGPQACSSLGQNGSPVGTVPRGVAQDQMHAQHPHLGWSAVRRFRSCPGYGEAVQVVQLVAPAQPKMCNKVRVCNRVRAARTRGRAA